jgi:hypothetical protein
MCHVRQARQCRASWSKETCAVGLWGCDCVKLVTCHKPPPTNLGTPLQIHLYYCFSVYNVDPPKIRSNQQGHSQPQQQLSMSPTATSRNRRPQQNPNPTNRTDLRFAGGQFPPPPLRQLQHTPAAAAAARSRSGAGSRHHCLCVRVTEIAYKPDSSFCLAQLFPSENPPARLRSLPPPCPARKCPKT